MNHAPRLYKPVPFDRFFCRLLITAEGAVDFLVTSRDLWTTLFSILTKITTLLLTVPPDLSN